MGRWTPSSVTLGAEKEDCSFPLSGEIKDDVMIPAETIYSKHKHFE